MQARTTRKPPKRLIPASISPSASGEVLDTSPETLGTAWITAVAAIEEKQGVDIRALDLRQITPMADVFIICHGRNQRQNQAIADEVEKRLREEEGRRPIAIEGLSVAEWILMDYGDLVIHIFSEKAREYYDLERLYRDATHLSVPERYSTTQ